LSIVRITAQYQTKRGLRFYKGW